MKVICSTANKFKDCNCGKCPHGKPHEPIDSVFTYENGKKIPSGKCTSSGRCYIGTNMEWDCQCNPVKKGKMKNKSGWTLFETMIVVAIIGLLAAVAIPFFLKAKRGNIEPPVISSEQVLNNYNVKFLFEIDGAKVYRFTDYSIRSIELHYIAIPKTPVILERTDSSK